MDDDEDDNQGNEKKLKAKLSERELKVLKMRFGIDASENDDLEEVSKQFDVIRARIREIEEKALKKLGTRKKEQNQNSLTCSFCGKSENATTRIIKSDTDATICKECVLICVDILKEEDEI